MLVFWLLRICLLASSSCSMGLGTGTSRFKNQGPRIETSAFSQVESYAFKFSSSISKIQTTQSASYIVSQPFQSPLHQPSTRLPPTLLLPCHHRSHFSPLHSHSSKPSTTPPHHIALTHQLGIKLASIQRQVNVKIHAVKSPLRRIHALKVLLQVLARQIAGQCDDLFDAGVFCVL